MLAELVDAAVVIAGPAEGEDADIWSQRGSKEDSLLPFTHSGARRSSSSGAYDPFANSTNAAEKGPCVLASSAILALTCSQP
jgi:hypothetical protein